MMMMMSHHNNMSNSKHATSTSTLLSSSSSTRLLQVVAAVPGSAYVLLASAVISLALIGPLLELQQGVGPILKVYWRTSLTAYLLFPLAVYHYVSSDSNTITTITTTPLAADASPKEGIEGISSSGSVARRLGSLFWPRFTWMQLIMVMLTAFCYMIVCNFFVLALTYTSIGNAVILSNTVSLMLLIGKFCMGSPVTLFEACGALTAFAGAVLCSKDSSEVAPDSNVILEGGDGSDATISMTYLGDFYALVAAVGGVGYLVFAKRVRSFMNLYVFMFCNMFLSSLYSLAYLYWSNAPLSWNTHRNHGVFGWVHWDDWDRLPLELIMVIVCNFIGALGYIRAMHYFDNLVIAVCTLIKPVVAELMACLLGVGFLPGWKGWLGNALVICGTFAVVYQPPNSNNNDKGLH